MHRDRATHFFGRRLTRGSPPNCSGRFFPLNRRSPRESPLEEKKRIPATASDVRA
jgi:hypothetical protein